MVTQNQYARIGQPLKWHGGKYYLAPKIIELMPSHIHYVEPFAGGLAVLLAKNPIGVSEVVNDLDGDLVNFWRCLADEEFFGRMMRLVECTPFSEELWHNSSDEVADPVERAVQFFIRCRQSLAGRMACFSPLSRNRTRSGMNEQCSAWLNAIEGLPAVHERLKRVAILNRPATEVIRSQDGENTLFYCDPPYLHETRADADTYGDCEMSDDQHRELLELLAGIRGRFLLSGYPSELYDEYASRHGWRCTVFEVANNAASGKSKKRMSECVWHNFVAAEESVQPAEAPQQDLFD